MNSRKRIILFPQDKGGIGKTYVAALIFDFLMDKGVRLKAFDLDHANSTFNRLVPEAEFIDTDVDDDKLGALDLIIDALPDADTVLVDNRATGASKLLTYLEAARLPELQAELGLSLTFVVVATDDKDANSQVMATVARFEDRVKWIIARNQRDSVDLPLFSQSNSRKKLLELGAIELDVPCLLEVTRNRLQQANLTVGRGRFADQLHLLDRSRCIRYHELMRAEFAKAQGILFE